MTLSRRKGFYGWFSLSGVVLMQLLESGSCMLSFGVFLPVICQDLGWSRGTASISMTIGLISFGLPGPIWGILTNKLGPRKMLISGSLLLMLGLAGMSIVHEAWQAYVFFSLAGLGSGMGGFIPSSAIVNNWFVNKRSLAMGIFSASVGAGGLVFPPLITLLISLLGWRVSWLVLAGIIVLGCTLIGGLILVRNRPEDLGQQPDGRRALSDVIDMDIHQKANEFSNGWQMKQVLRHPTTWLITIFAASMSFAYFTVSGHQIAYLQDIGFSPIVAASTMSLLSGMSVVGSLIFGFIALRINVKKMTVLGMGIMVFALCILLLSSKLSFIFVYVSLFGMASGALTAALPTLVGNFYGRTMYPQIIGIITALQMLGSFGPVIAGAIYDGTQSYMPAFILITTLCLVGFFCVLFARYPELSRDR